ncbi:MAG: adventurous gliding motility lipoprotein CglC [Myxococcota bacterium]
MTVRKLAAGAAAFLSLGLWGCPIATDVGKECILVKKDPSDPTGKRSIPIKEREIAANKDFVSFGAVECEDLVCVRDLNFQRPATATDETAAVGYCSRSCIATSTLGCTQSDESLNNDPATKMNCRPLILDETTLAAICQTDSNTCKRYFGDTSSPFFCARGGVTDGGTP